MKFEQNIATFICFIYISRYGLVHLDSVKEAEQCKAQLDKAPLIIVSLLFFHGQTGTDAVLCVTIDEFEDHV